MSTLKGDGDKITIDPYRKIFVKGAYNLGPVYESRIIKSGSTTIYPGSSIEHDSGTGGEDDYIVGSDKGSDWYGVAEFDPGLIASGKSTYEVLDEIPGIPFHMNPGAYCQGIRCVDASAVTEADQGLTSGSGTTGTFKAMVEATLGTITTPTYGFATATWGTNSSGGTQHYPRIYMRNAYYLGDPTETIGVVAYIATAGM